MHDEHQDTTMLDEPPAPEQSWHRQLDDRVKQGTTSMPTRWFMATIAFALIGGTAIGGSAAASSNADPDEFSGTPPEPVEVVVTEYVDRPTDQAGLEQCRTKVEWLQESLLTMTSVAATQNEHVQQLAAWFLELANGESSSYSGSTMERMTDEQRENTSDMKVVAAELDQFLTMDC